MAGTVDTTPVRPVDPRAAREEHDRVLAAGEHIFQQLEFREVPTTADLAIELDVDAKVKNPRGGLQGGLIAALVDIVAGRAVVEGGGPYASVATADLDVHFLRGVTGGPARAEATVVRRGRTLAVVTVDVTDVATGALCAVSTLSFSLALAGDPPSTEQNQEP